MIDPTHDLMGNEPELNAAQLHQTPLCTTRYNLQLPNTVALVVACIGRRLLKTVHSGGGHSRGPLSLCAFIDDSGHRGRIRYRRFLFFLLGCWLTGLILVFVFLCHSKMHVLSGHSSTECPLTSRSAQRHHWQHSSNVGLFLLIESSKI